MMANLCIVCEAFLQPCEEFLLCDGCRKPAETSLDDESPISDGVEDTPLHPEHTHRFQTKIQTEDRKITRVKRRLIC